MKYDNYMTVNIRLLLMLIMPFFLFILSSCSKGNEEHSEKGIIIDSLHAEDMNGGNRTEVISYGGVAPEKYLCGMFDPSKNSEFICINDLGIRTDGRRHYLRKKAAAALKRMMAAFHADNPDVPFWIQSSTRTFYDQRSIWNSKFNGSRKVEGKDLKKTIPDPLERSLKILEYSSMPGTSRHHWGTDFDINRLTNSYYENGNGAVLFSWLEKNAADYGFYRPYNAGRNEGYAEERWHWSFVPESVQFLNDWVELYNRNRIDISREGLFEGSTAAGKLAPRYVLSINSECR